jgi:hypothetical protein
MDLLQQLCDSVTAGQMPAPLVQVFMKDGFNLSTRHVMTRTYPLDAETTRRVVALQHAIIDCAVALLPQDNDEVRSFIMDLV